jgi:Uncharacterised nucleotidyltransferase
MDDQRGDAGHPTRRLHTLDEFLRRVAVRPDREAHTSDLDAAAADVFGAFRAASIDGLLLKGPALARLLYGNSEARGYLDIDLMVAPRDLAKARVTLAELGYETAGDALGIRDVGGVAHAETWVAAGPGAMRQLLVELHLWLAGSRAAAPVAWDRLAARRTELELCGQSVPVLNEEGLAMHLALHAAQHGSSYRRGQRELALALDRWPFRVWKQAAGLAAEIDAVDAFAAGLRLVPAGAQLAKDLGLPATDRLDWEIRHVATRPRGTFHLEALVARRGFRGRVEVLRHALLPSREWIGRENPWARRGGAALVLGYAVHLGRVPAWAVRAWRFRRRARRARRTN